MNTIFEGLQKLLFSLALVSTLALGVVGVVGAQTDDSERIGPSECCQIHRTIEIGGNTYGEGDIVGRSLGDDCPAAGDGATVNTDAPRQWGIVCFLNTLNRLVDYIVLILVFVAVLMIVFGAFTFITSQGDEDKTKKGKDYLLFALIGLVVAAFARMLPNLVSFIVGI